MILYMGVESFDDPDQCQHLFTGEMKPYDTITHMVLHNQINAAEKCISVCSTPCKPAPRRLDAFRHRQLPLLRPRGPEGADLKELLEENDRLLDTVKLDKDDYHLLKYYNMMVINRPASLFLEP